MNNIIEQQSPKSQINLDQPLHAFQLTELSVLAMIAVFLIRGIWKEHCETEKAERELINKLIDEKLKNGN